MEYKWFITSKNDAFNLDNIFHIWVEKCPSGYFLMGEIIHSEEEVVLSETYDNEEKCREFLYKLIKVANQEF